MKMIVFGEEREVIDCQVVVKRHLYDKLCYFVQLKCRTNHFGYYEWISECYYLDPEEALQKEQNIKEAIYLDETKQSIKAIIEDFTFNDLLLDQEVGNEK